MRACLESLGKLNYPDYEVILVDDGSTDNTAEIAAQFPECSLHSPDQSRLESRPQHRRRRGQGRVFAYTDSDCMADADWLYYLIGTLLSGDYAGVGGPNITPPAQKLDPGVRRGRAGRTQSRSAYRHRRRAYSRL